MQDHDYHRRLTPGERMTAALYHLDGPFDVRDEIPMKSTSSEGGGEMHG